MLTYDTVHSFSDGGWYAEIYRTDTGEQLYVTDLYDTKSKAKKAAQNWIEEWNLQHPQPESAS